jgi:hypothetical protein
VDLREFNNNVLYSVRCSYYQVLIVPTAACDWNTTGRYEPVMNSEAVTERPLDADRQYR